MPSSPDPPPSGVEGVSLAGAFLLLQGGGARPSPTLPPDRGAGSQRTSYPRARGRARGAGERGPAAAAASPSPPVPGGGQRGGWRSAVGSARLGSARPRRGPRAASARRAVGRSLTRPPARSVGAPGPGRRRSGGRRRGPPAPGATVAASSRLGRRAGVKGRGDRGQYRFVMLHDKADDD